MAWPLLDRTARDEMVADQFLNGLDSHKLWVQVAATGIWRIEDLMCVTRSLEAVEGQEAGHGRQWRGSTRTRFWPNWDPNSDRVGTLNDAHPLQDPNK